MILELLQQGQDLTLVKLVGRLDSSGVRDIQEQFFAKGVAPGRNLIVDCAEVDCIMSTGMRLFVSAAKALEVNKAKLILVKPNTTVREALNMVCLDSLMPVCDNMEQAIGLLQ